MKMNKIAASLALLAAATLSNTVLASTVTVATPVDQAEFTAQVVLNQAGLFSDRYNFTISAPISDAGASITNHNVKLGTKTVTNINNIQLQIFDATNTLLSTSGNEVSAYLPGIAAGSYHAIVTGSATGTGDKTGKNYGAYQMSIYAEPSAVPVPAAVWLLGSGLLGLVGIARRKEAA